MKIIAHRGLMVGPDPEAENQLDTLDEALSYGLDVEVDVRLIGGELLIGHDESTLVCPTWLYDDKRAWFHAKNTDALVYLNNRGKRVFYHTDEETIFQESALYKVKSSSLFEERHIQNIIKKSQAKIVTVSPEFFVIEIKGFRHETENLRSQLEPYGLMQFVRSGRISVSKEKMNITEILNKFNEK